MTDKYEELRAALDAGPTPGPRSIKEVGDSHRIVVRGGSVSGVMAFIETWWPHPEQQSEQRANALLIAAANPETIRALLADHDELIAAGGQAVRWAPSSAHWSNELRRIFGNESREGIDALESQLRKALAERDAMRDALSGIVDLYDTDEGCRSLPQYIAARAALSGEPT